MMTEVSVLMTVYNGMPYLPEAVRSVLRQTLADLRLVIVNDGSTDGTAEYLEGLDDRRIVVIHQPNRGTAAAANRGLEHCDTEFTARMDADDVALPERLERERDFLRAHPEVGVVGTQVALLGDERVGSNLRLPTAHADIFAALMQGRHAMAHSTIMFRTALLNDLGGYWSLPLVDDWDMMLRMGEVAELANIDEVLHHYRVHAGSLNGAGMWRMRESVAYSCELARRRQTGRPAIGYDEFHAARQRRPLWQKARESVEIHARTQYRVAVAELCGGRRVRGSTRLAWAALCAPGLTWQRISRVFAAPGGDRAR